MGTGDPHDSSRDLFDRSFERIEQLFHDARALAHGERADMLAAAEPDPDVRAQVLRLLEADVADVDMLAPAAAIAAQSAMTQGLRLGPWRITRELGAGGMGTVFEAERADAQFEQRVAIKLMRGFPTADGMERLRRERQILAELDHANIARLLDGGETADGQPYLVMECVAGATLGDWLVTHTLDRAARLALFDKIAAAVEHAHQHLVIHRDLKPGNVMVRDDGEPKLLDFGVAKLVDLSDDLPARHTSTRLCTPGYASPEQRAGKAVTTATDVYSLGVLLQEILTGVRPDAADASQTARWSPVPVDSELRGLLDFASAENPMLRYPTVEALREDLGRYREGHPLRAARATRRYRLRKFIARHRLGAAATLVALIAAALFTWRLGVERNTAVAAQAESDRQFRFLATLFAGIGNPGPDGKPMGANALLDRARELSLSGLANDTTARAEIEALLGNAYLNASRYADASAMYRASIEHASQSTTAPQLAARMRQLAQVLHASGDSEQALHWLDRAQSLLTEPPADPVEAELGAQIRLTRIRATRKRSTADMAAAVDQAMAYADRYLPRSNRVHALILSERIGQMEQLGRVAEAVPLRRGIVAAMTADSKTNRRDIAWQRMNLARDLGVIGSYAEAVQQLDAADRDFQVAFAGNADVGRAHLELQRSALGRAQGDPGAAEAAFARALAWFDRVDYKPQFQQWMLGGAIAEQLDRSDVARERFNHALEVATSEADRTSVRQAMDRLARAQLAPAPSPTQAGVAQRQ